MDAATVQMLSVPQARARLGIGATTMYGLIRDGRVRSIKIGSRRLIPESSLAEYVASLATSDEQRTA